MTSVKTKTRNVETNSTSETKFNEELFNRSFKVFQKIGQEKKRELKKHEYHLSTRLKKRAKHSNAMKKQKKRK